MCYQLHSFLSLTVKLSPCWDEQALEPLQVLLYLFSSSSSWTAGYWTFALERLDDVNTYHRSTSLDQSQSPGSSSSRWVIPLSGGDNSNSFCISEPSIVRQSGGRWWTFSSVMKRLINLLCYRMYTFTHTSVSSTCFAPFFHGLWQHSAALHQSPEEFPSDPTQNPDRETEININKKLKTGWIF